jgi:hypothetical protein
VSVGVIAASQSTRTRSSASNAAAARSNSKGFPESQYASVAHALIQTLHYLNANIWSTSTGSTWISFFLWVEPQLLAGARAAASRAAAAREAAARETTAQRAAAEQEAARVAALAHDQRGGHSQVVGDVNIERVASLLDDDDDDDVGFGQIMLGMTRNRPRH